MGKCAPFILRCEQLKSTRELIVRCLLEAVLCGCVAVACVSSIAEFGTMPRGWGQKYDYEAKPRKACTPYNFYVQETYRWLRRTLRDRDPGRILVEIGARWKRLPRYDKQKYVEMAKWDKIGATEARMEYEKKVTDGTIVPKPRRPRVSKQEGYPRPTLNAFLYFANANRKKVNEECPCLDARETMTELSRRWKDMTPRQKDPYVAQRKADKRRFNQQLVLFRQKQKTEKRLKRVEQQRERLRRMVQRRGETWRSMAERPEAVMVDV